MRHMLFVNKLYNCSHAFFVSFGYFFSHKHAKFKLLHLNKLQRLLVVMSFLFFGLFTCLPILSTGSTIHS